MDAAPTHKKTVLDLVDPRKSPLLFVLLFILLIPLIVWGIYGDAFKRAGASSSLESDFQEADEGLSYTFHALGTLGGDYADVNAINNEGLLAGDSDLFPELMLRGGFVWSEKDGMSKIVMDTCEADIYATDINDLGIVVGYQSCYVPSGYLAGYLYDSVSGDYEYLATFPNADVTMPIGINNEGGIIGNAGNQLTHAIYWSDSNTILDLNIFLNTGFASARDINDSGIIVGEFLPAGGSAEVPYMLDINDPYNYTSLPLLPGGSSGSALSINADGVIVGYSYTVDDEIHAVKWVEGQVIDLGTLGGTRGRATSVNANGEIVGSSMDSSGNLKPFLYKNDQMYNLLDFVMEVPDGLQITDVYKIADNGDIIGRTVTEDYFLGACVLTLGD